MFLLLCGLFVVDYAGSISVRILILFQIGYAALLILEVDCLGAPLKQRRFLFAVDLIRRQLNIDRFIFKFLIPLKQRIHHFPRQLISFTTTQLHSRRLLRPSKFSVILRVCNLLHRWYILYRDHITGTVFERTICCGEHLAGEL